MELKEIKSSGMLELYVLGRLNPAESKLVEDAMASNQDVRIEVADIEKVLEYYAGAYSVAPSAGLKTRILKEIGGGKTTATPSSSGFNWLATALALAVLALGYMLWSQGQQMNKLEQNHAIVKSACDSIQDAATAQIALLNQLNDRNNNIIPIAATEKYATTNLYFHHNPVAQRNFIQVKNLPAIDENQSYQLWSLKGSQAPIPLDVFRVDGQLIIPVRHESNTGTYAITIEQRAGASSPNLANLIGTFTIS